MRMSIFHMGEEQESFAARAWPLTNCKNMATNFSHCYMFLYYMTLQPPAHRELDSTCLPSESEFGHMTYFGNQDISTDNESRGLKNGACWLLLLGTRQPPYKETQVSLLEEERPMARDAVLAEAPDMRKAILDYATSVNLVQSGSQQPNPVKQEKQYFSFILSH